MHTSDEKMHAREDRQSVVDLASLSARLDKLEAMMTKLLEHAGAPPQHPASLELHHRNQKRKPWADMSSGAEFASQLESGIETSCWEDTDDDMNDKWCEDESPAKRLCAEALPSPLSSMHWYSLDKEALSTAQWGRVKGDGNCFWRAVGVLTHTPWKEVKQQALSVVPELRDTWINYFRSDPVIFDQTAASMHAENAYANEIAIPCVAHIHQRPVVVKGVGQAFAVHTGSSAAEWNKALVVQLSGEHFTPLSSDLSAEQILQLAEAAPMHVCVEVRGGSTTPPSTLITWNCSSLQRHAPEMLALGADLVCLQETGLTTRGQKRLQHELKSEGYTLLCGAPTPLTQTKQGWRPGRGSVPGVAVAARSHLDIREHPPLTPAAKQLVGEGRLLGVSVKFRSFRALLFCLYCQSGWDALACARRAGQMNAMVQEVAAHKHIPILIASDWNDPPATNMAVGLLGDENYHVPLMQTDDSLSLEHPTHSRTGSGRMLDYWLLSPHFHCAVSQQVIPMPVHEHSAVRINVPQIKPSPPAPMIPSRAEYDLTSLVHPSPVDWELIQRQVSRYLELSFTDLAFALWSDAWHRELASSSQHAAAAGETHYCR